MTGSLSLVCPRTKLPLRASLLADAEREVAAGRPLVPREPGGASPVGPTPTVLVREDRRCAYPVVDGVPILLAPEMLTAPDRREAFDLRDPRYAEAYEEMDFYNQAASTEAASVEQSQYYRRLAPVMNLTDDQKTAFPDPWSLWIDAVFDGAAQADAYRHLMPLKGRRVLQIGGTGAHAVKFVLAGAAAGILITPMLGEATLTLALARALGVGDRVACVVAVGEELPFPPASIDGIYSGGCVHHMDTALALPEAARILTSDGRFAAVDPWRAPLYAIGTKVFGKREPDVYCRPLTTERIAPLRGAFSDGRVVQHGTLTRYPLLALKKVGLELGPGIVRSVVKVDDAICSLIPGVRGMGSSVALLARK